MIFYITIHNDSECKILGKVLAARQKNKLSNLFYSDLQCHHTKMIFYINIHNDTQSKIMGKVLAARQVWRGFG